MLVRTDPDEHRLAYLSIPRDLRVEIPGAASDKINAAYASAGRRSRSRRSRALTGLPVNHVDRRRLRDVHEVVDAIGGITVD